MFHGSDKRVAHLRGTVWIQNNDLVLTLRCSHERHALDFYSKSDLIPPALSRTFLADFFRSP